MKAGKAHKRALRLHGGSRRYPKQGGESTVMTTKRIRRRFGDNICRRCINSTYHVRLNPSDCLYRYSSECRCCGGMHHIVAGFRLSGRLKMLLKF